MAIKHHEISRQAAFIAKNSAAWAADFLTLPEQVSRPVRDDSVKRFVAEMRDRLDRIEEMHRKAE